jgi:F-type H+-transporting ATPase subunit b
MPLAEGDRTMLKRVLCSLLLLVIGLATASPILASDTAPSGEGGMNPLAPSEWKADLAIWTAVVFLVLFIILKKFAWKPLADALDKREQGVADQIAQAGEANRQAKDLLASYEKKLAEAQTEVRVILEQGRRDAEQVGHQMLDKAKEEAKAEQQRALQQIEAATSAAVQELADRSAAMAIDLAGKIVGAKLTAGDHTTLINQAVAGFVQRKNAQQEASRN